MANTPLSPPSSHSCPGTPMGVLKKRTIMQKRWIKRLKSLRNDQILCMLYALLPATPLPTPFFNTLNMKKSKTKKAGFVVVCLSALGVVFGDIGTYFVPFISLSRPLPLTPFSQEPLPSTCTSPSLLIVRRSHTLHPLYITILPLLFFARLFLVAPLFWSCPLAIILPNPGTDFFFFVSCFYYL
jgi:hypothetical protein